MFTKAFRALSSGSRDKDRYVDDPYIDHPSSRRRATGTEPSHRQLQEPITFDSLQISDSDSDEYGLPQVRKSSISKHDSHKRTVSHEHADIEYKCPCCGEQYRFKSSDSWPPCKYCGVKPLDPRRRPLLARPAPSHLPHKQLRTPRQLEESFRDLYRRLGLIIHDDGAEQNMANGAEVQRAGNGSVTALATDGHGGQAGSPKKVVTYKAPIDKSGFLVQDSFRSNGTTQTSDVRTPPNRDAPFGPPLHPSNHNPSYVPPGIWPLRPTPSAHNSSLTTPYVGRRPISRGSPSIQPSGASTSPRKGLLRGAHGMNGNGSRQLPTDSKARAKLQILDHFQMEFRNFYGDADFLNAEFCTSIRPKISKRSLSEGSTVSLKSHEEGAVRPMMRRHDRERPAPTKVDTGKALPTIPALGPVLPDSKSLLAGHLHDVVSSLADYGEARPIERSTTVARKSTYQTTPHVNYAELHAYHSTLTRYTLDVDYCLTLVTRDEDGLDKRAAARSEVVHFAANLLVSCLDSIYDLLTSAREDPASPQGARYLLLILATPWFLRPLSPLAAEFERWHGEQLTQGRHEQLGRYDDEARLLLLQHPERRTGSSLRDRIISLLVGRISHLPDTVQHVFARWFANIPVNIYVGIMKAVQAFNLTYIRRIPEQQHPKTEETKQLHDRRFLSEMLGAANIQHFNNDSDTLPWYSKKKSAWKLRASCQSLQLLVVANDIRNDTTARYSTLPGQMRPLDDTYQPFPVDYFYTPLLDPEAGRLDIALDFELWDSKRGKFTMCQYPFLLTLGTKVRVLEYDNERRKKDAVRQEWHASKGMSADPYFHLHIRRNHIIDDSFKLIRQAVGSSSKVMSKKLRVYFEGEEGVDAGGPQKEWFLILTQELFNPDLGLFYLSDSGHFWFHSACNRSNEYYELVGAVFGLAIYNQTPLFAPFPPFLFKKLAAAAPRQADAGISWRHLWRPTLQDYAELSPDFAKVLKEGLVDPSIMQGLTFEIPMWQNGQSVYHPLDSDGSDREITPANIKEFVEKAVTYVLRDSIKNQFTAFARGFHSICGGNALSLFRGEELELLVRGSEDFDLDTLRAAVLYDNWKRPGTKEDLQDEDDVKRDYPVVRMFWNYFESADIKERRRILRFVTGTDRLPPAGIVNLVIKVSRQEMGKGEFRYPSARTCFNQILLPDCFKEQAVFNRVFRNALDMAGTGFGMK